MADKKKNDDHLPGYDPETRTTTLPANSDFKPADFSAGSFPTHAKAITKKDDQMVQAPPPLPVGYADGGIVQPDDHTQAINDYFTNQKQSVDQFGPDYQKAVADHLTQQQNGLGHNVAKAGAGFADALMQGVARAGNPGFLSGIQNQDQRNFENQTNLGKSLNEQNQAGIKEKMGMDLLNPASVPGAAKMHGAFTAMKSAFPQMADNDIQTFVSSPAFSELFPQLAALRGKQIESGPRITEANTGIKNAATAATKAEEEARHNKGEEELTGKARDTSAREATIRAAEAIVKDYSPLKPGGPSRHEYNEALKVLSTSITGQNGISNSSQFNHEAIPSGQTYQAPDGTWRKKR